MATHEIRRRLRLDQWPTRYGGRGLSLQHERAFLDLESRYDVPAQTAFGSGIGIVAPTVLAHGPEWMKDEYLAPIHRGDVITCQFLSEPDAGSDLAAVRTRAEADGDDWVITGQKVWSSNAHHAAVGLLLAPARTRRRQSIKGSRHSCCPRISRASRCARCVR